MKETIIKIIQRLVYNILLFICIIGKYYIYIPIAMVTLIPLCGLIWIISGKSYYNTILDSYYNNILDFPDKFYYIDKYLIKLLRINK